MSSLQTYIDPVSTKQLLSTLCLAIDETKLVLSLNAIEQQINQADSSKLKTDRIDYLQKEKTVLTARLNYIRDRAKFS